MRKVIILLVVVLATYTLNAQVMGVSASKLAAMNGETAARNQVEFEPGFGYFWANKHYNEDGKLENFNPDKDSTAVFQAMAFRITYGISDRFESGILIASDMSSFSFGMKYNLFKNDDGSISLHQDNSIIHLHSLCYALEGLIYGYYVTNDENYLNYCENALNWFNSQIEDDGGIELWFNSSFTHAKTSYHIAQVIRLMILFNKIKQTDVFQKSITSLFNFMFSLHIINGDKRIKGGFYEEFYKSLFGWKKRSRVNSWGTLFALQAIYMNDNFEKISFKEIIDYLY